MEILKGHLSPETAYIVDDYPYGFRLRCKIRYWLEVHKKHGVRFVSQTTNPKRGDIWNKPRASTYCALGGAMFLDDNGHVKWNGASYYDDANQLLNFISVYGEGIPPAIRAKLDEWIKAKQRYEEKVKNGVDWQVAGRETAIEMVVEKRNKELSLL